MREFEKTLFELSKLEFDNYEAVEEWLEKNFSKYSGAELPDPDRVAFLICDYRLLLVFKCYDGKWKFDYVELTGYALNQDFPEY
jgi:hypothetical protein